jgi:RNA polymerase sigma-70 factor, ECF subfamily
MGAVKAHHTEDHRVVAAAQRGDEAAFGALAERYRRELQVHCYRMLGSFEDAEDLVQETLLRAWRKRDGFEGRSTVRAWLYRIATNACLDVLERHPRQPGARQAFGEAPTDATRGAPTEIQWLQPFPDHLLDAVAPPETEPDAIVIVRETL